MISKTQKNWRSWRNSKNPEEIIRGPWNHWRRSFLLFALACLLFAFAPWIFETDPLPRETTPEEILQSGRVGEPVPWGSTIFFHPGAPNAPSSAQEVFRYREKSPVLAPLRDKGTRPLPPLPSGELARFRGTSIERSDLRRLLRAEQSLAGSQKPDRGLARLVLQRSLEEAWLRQEAQLQGVEIHSSQIEALLDRYPQEARRLRSAGFSSRDIRYRVEALVLAVAIRNLLRGDLARFESEWVQRWKPQTFCRVQLPICR